jgi:serine/threonine protein kinase
MQTFNHPNLPKMDNSFVDDSMAYIVTEYVGGGELFDRIIAVKQLSEKMASSIIKQILSAIAYCHDRGIYHLDLKPENLLLDANYKLRIVVIDFGFNDFLGSSKLLKTKKGSESEVRVDLI